MHIVGKVAAALKSLKKELKESKILIVGVAYKRDTDDVRESPAVEILRQHQRLTGEDREGRVFPGPRPRRVMSDNTVNSALRLLEYDTSKEHCAHGFRVSTSSPSRR